MKEKLKIFLSIFFNVVLVVLLIFLLFKDTKKDQQVYVTKDDFEKEMKRSFQILNDSLLKEISSKMQTIEKNVITYDQTNSVPEVKDFQYVPRGYDFCIVNAEPRLLDQNFNITYTVGSICPFSPRNFIENIGPTFVELSNGDIFIRDTRQEVIRGIQDAGKKL